MPAPEPGPAPEAAPGPAPGPEPRPALGRRRWRDVIGELHYQLRTEADTPARNAAAIGLGTFIGCVPLYGTHLLLCVLFARLFRLSRIVTYLAAHINNPLTAPWLLAAALSIGHRAASGTWPALRISELARMGALDIGRDILVGSLILGAGLGVALGSIAWIVGRRSQHESPWRRKVDEVSRRYLGGGVFHWEFVRGKLRHDPVYRAIEPSLLRLGGGTLLDLGCGRGIALALADHARGNGGPAPPVLVGVERSAAIAAVARAALGARARIVEADITEFEPPPADLILIVDVLHYLDAGAQERVLDRAARALRPGGRLLLREADAGGGLRFRLIAAAERAAALGRGAWRQRFHYRTAAAWSAILETAGLETTPLPMPGGPPLANALIEARRPGP
jgi:SAM-dependent methyltransferase